MRNLVCPHCGAAAPASRVLLRTKVKSKDSLASDIDGGTVFEVPGNRGKKRIYGMMRCQCCGEAFAAQIEGKDWVAVYPIAGKIVDRNVDERVKREFEVANWCFALGEYRGCVYACVSILEALWRDLKVSGLLQLMEKGLISPELYEKGKEVRLWGDVANEELVGEVVEEGDAEELLAYLEAVLNEAYAKRKRLSRSVEKRKKSEGRG